MLSQAGQLPAATAEQRIQLLETLHDISSLIRGSADLPSTLHQIAEAIRQRFDFTAVGVGLVEGNEIVFRAIAPEPAQRELWTSLTSGVCGRVIETGEAAFITSVNNDSGVVRNFQDVTQELCAPIRVDGRVVGVLDVGMSDVRDASETDRSIVPALADQIGLEITYQWRTQELERRTQHLRTVERITTVIASKTLIRDAAEEILVELERAFGFGSVAILLTEGDRVRLLAMHQASAGNLSELFEQGTPLGVGVVGRVAQTGQPAFLRNVRDDPDYLENYSDVHSEICVPITVEERTVGVLNVETPSSRPLDELDFEAITIVANHLGIAIAKSDTYQTQINSRNAMEALQRVTSIVASTLNTEEALRLIVETLSQAFNYPVVAFRTRDQMTLVSWLADGVDPAAKAEDVPLGAGVVAFVAATGQPVFIPDVTKDPRYVMMREDITSEICLPLRYAGQMLGVLNVEGTAERPLTEHDMELLQTFADHAGILLNNARQYEQLQEVASRDPMTNLPNHREFQYRLREELGRAERHGRPVALLLMDLNDFKLVNDVHGHLAGDQLKKLVAMRLEEGLRESDVLARYAGDEFVAILPETLRAEAELTAERLRASVLASPFAVRPGVEARVGLSVGVACFPDDAREPADLIQLADDAMYRAKQRYKQEQRANNGPGSSRD